MALPEPLPRALDNSFVLETWAEGGTATEPLAGVKATGYLAGATVPMPTINWLSREPLRYARVVQAECLRASQALVGSWLYPGITGDLLGTWSGAGAPPLNGFLSDVAGLATRAVDVWVDLGEGAVGLQVKISNATPLLFTANSDNYVFLPVTAALAINTDLVVLPVAIAAPAPATPVGTVLFWIVTTDGVGIVGQSIEVPQFPVMKQVGFELLGVQDLFVAGDLDVTGASMLKGDTSLGDGAAPTVHTLGFDVLDLIPVPGTATFAELTSFTTGVQGTGATPLEIVVGVQGPGATPLELTRGAQGPGATPLELPVGVEGPLAGPLEIVAGVQGPAAGPLVLSQGATVPAGKVFTSEGTNTFTGLVGQPAVTAQGAIASASAGLSASGDGVGPGVTAVGGVTAPGIVATSISGSPAIRGSGNPAQSASAGVEGLALHVSASGIIGRAALGALGGAAGIRGVGDNLAPGLWGVGDAAPAGFFVGDLTSPVAAAIRCAPQDADPTSPALGDLFFNGTRQAWRVFTTLYKSLHASAKGLVRAWGSPASGSILAGGVTLDISLAAIEPEQVGAVLVTVTGTLDYSTDIATAKVFIRDVTAGVTINGGGAGWTERATDIDSGATSGRDRSFIARSRYTLPDAALRTFAVQISATAGDVDYTEVIVDVDGVL